MITTFEDLQNKYFQASKCMKDNNEFVVNPTIPLNAEWFNYETSARWTLGSSHEFLKDFMELSKQVQNVRPEQAALIVAQSRELNQEVKYLREYMKLKFPHNPLIQEAVLK